MSEGELWRQGFQVSAIRTELDCLRCVRLSTSAEAGLG